MTLFTKEATGVGKVTWYYRCTLHPRKHRFEMPHRELMYCPICNARVVIYGLRDSPVTPPADDD